MKCFSKTQKNQTSHQVEKLQHLSRKIAARGNELANLLMEHWETWDELNAILEAEERDIVEIYSDTLSNWGDCNDEIEAFLNHLLKTKFSEQ